MAVLGKGFLALLFTLTAACSGGGFGGIAGSKNGGKKQLDKERENDEALDSDDEANDPVEVAGAFLVGACAPTTLTPSFAAPNDVAKPYGCALVDQDQHAKASCEVSFSSIVLDFKDGTQTTLTYEKAPHETPWHVLSYLEPAKVTEVAGIRSYGSCDGQSFETYNKNLKVYDPEGLIGVTEQTAPAKDSRPLFVHASSVAKNPEESANVKYAIDGKAGSPWVFEADHGENVWVVFDLGESYKLERIEYALCEPVSGAVKVQRSTSINDGAASMLASPTDVAEYAAGFSDTSLQVIEPAPGTAYDQIRYLRFDMSRSAGVKTCLDEVAVFATTIAAQGQTDPKSEGN